MQAIGRDFLDTRMHRPGALLELQLAEFGIHLLGEFLLMLQLCIQFARAMLRVLERNPLAVFMIEGHTDAVGSDEDNLSLSDRRAAAVAEVLSDSFGVPAENLVTQGYGEQFLKDDTKGPERANRRVTVRRVTPLIAEQ